MYLYTSTRKTEVLTVFDQPAIATKELHGELGDGCIGHAQEASAHSRMDRVDEADQGHVKGAAQVGDDVR